MYPTIFSMKYKHLLSSFVCLFVCVLSYGQEKCFFTHYGAEDGLPQHTVMSIVQDQKGFMWFSTWNGLSKFDGYNFKSYKIQQGDVYHMRSNRIDFICEDKYGNIWAIPYDREPQRFDPRTEKFMGLRSLPPYKDLSFSATRIIPTQSGKVWLISDKMGCVNVADSAFQVELFNVENQKLHGNTVYAIHEDTARNSWILTNNGLAFLSADGKKLSHFFYEKTYTNTKPNQSFYSVLELKNEIWFGSDNGRIWRYAKNGGLFSLLETGSTSAIKHINSIKENEIVITTQNDGFLVYNISLKKSTHYNTSNLTNMQNNRILSCYIDRLDNVWFELDCMGVAKFNSSTGLMKHFVPKIESFRSNVFPPNFFIFEDKDNRLWVHPRGGGFAMYNADKDELEPFYNEPSSASWRFSNMVHTAFSDKQGNLWLSTRSHGLDKVIFNNEVFKSMVVDPKIHSTINNDIRSIFEDSNYNLWISTKGEKTFVYDASGKQLGYLCANGSIGYAEPIKGVVYCIGEDHSKNMWIGTKGDGIYKLSPTSSINTYKISHYEYSENDIYSLSSNNIYSIFEDNQNRMWIGTYGGGLNLVSEDMDGKFINSRNKLKSYPMQFGSQVRVISADKFGNICIGTTLGLILFSPKFKQANTIDYKSYIRKPGDSHSLSGNDIYDICTTKAGETYFATFGGGVNKITEVDANGFPSGFTAYNTQDGLPSDVVLSIVEDSDQKLWIATEGNLTKFDTRNKSFETYSEVNRLMGAQNFSEGARFATKSGLVYFGFSKGVVSINPNRILSNTYKPYVALTKLEIANIPILVGEDSPLTENLDDQRTLKLNHTQNFINIEFAALDYIESKRIAYAYKLDGFNKDWIITTKERTANYTNLSPGNYVFRVKSTNSDGIWMDNEHTLDIEIKPSFWQTSWAYLLYSILLIALLYAILRTLFIFYRMKDKVKLEYEESEMKARFFTDISHEIRTPLTMIVSPVENIIDDPKTSGEIKSQLNIVLKNANRMLRMVNQILDFRKIQKLKLNIQETPIGEYVSDICHSFSKTAEFKNINLQVNNRIGDYKIWVDRDNIEKLVYNLLINAFKYTPVGKTIEVNVTNTKKDSAIILQIKDQGEGMPKEVLSKIFTRFASFNKDKNNPSTGIGLSIVKEVVDKHHARILVESEVDKGSCFTVVFQAGIEHFKNDSNATFAFEETAEDENLYKPESEKIEDQLNSSEKQKQTILVVEDDADLRTFLRTVLDSSYTIIEAENGKVGYEYASVKSPDFIISDIMMPEMDGIEFLQKIKEKPNTSHIPFILLTAKTNIDSKLEGLNYGADDYIEKPFSVKYLKARIDNIIHQRKQMYETFTRDKLANSLASTQQKKQTITSQDELFIKKIKEEVEKNIDNSDFLIDDLVAAMAMSRTVFFKKLKSLTGLAPVEFIRDIKIKYAAKLIKTQQYSIKEVSFMIGISDTKYFTQCFKKIYGMTPSEYKNSTDTVG